ncbi:ComF family protein [Flagellimonas okinawensis]|uniref:ComF family protein n=1 Tax=Flagellimonas okinawensis TaxID=3031324 RepID=A0ABT5XMN4_9FLAO|nr:ComF family protein [[Muricauda] okinawensis]MDF0707148.1 ComF family protein [[Muricauda] okinawensis]
MAKIINEINNILLPRVCFGCNAQLFSGEHTLCAVCRHDVPLTDHNYLEENAVDRIFYGRIPIKKAASFVYFTKNGIVKNLLHWLKYKNQEQIGQFFGNWYGSLLKENGQLKNIDAVIPVPLHPKKLKTRGYNQVAEFAKTIAENLGANYCDDWLIKTKNIKTQTKKGRQSRWESSKDAFELNTSLDNKFKRILLVDDVITTGATIESCAQTILRATEIEIFVLSMAVVPEG